MNILAGMEDSLVPRGYKLLDVRIASYCRWWQRKVHYTPRMSSYIPSHGSNVNWLIVTRFFLIRNVSSKYPQTQTIFRAITYLLGCGTRFLVAPKDFQGIFEKKKGEEKKLLVILWLLWNYNTYCCFFLLKTATDFLRPGTHGLSLKENHTETLHCVDGIGKRYFRACKNGFAARHKTLVLIYTWEKCFWESGGVVKKKLEVSLTFVKENNGTILTPWRRGEEAFICFPNPKGKERKNPGSYIPYWAFWMNPSCFLLWNSNTNALKFTSF